MLVVRNYVQKRRVVDRISPDLNRIFGVISIKTFQKLGELEFFPSNFCFHVYFVVDCESLDNEICLKVFVQKNDFDESAIHLNTNSMKFLSVCEGSSVKIKRVLNNSQISPQRVVYVQSKNHLFGPNLKNILVEEYLQGIVLLDRVIIPILNEFAEDYEIFSVCSQAKSEEKQFSVIGESTKIIFRDDRNFLVSRENGCAIPVYLGEKARTLKEILIHSRDDDDGGEKIFEYPRSFLICGPAGNMKREKVYTILLESLSIFPVFITPSDIYSSLLFENKLTKIYRSLIQRDGKFAIVFNELELLFPRDQKDFTLVRDFVSILQKKRDVFIFGISSHIEKVDEFVRKKFDEEYFFDHPAYEERRDLLKFMFDYFKIRLTESQVESVVSLTHQFLPSDVYLFFKNCSLLSWLRDKPDNCFNEMVMELKKFRPKFENEFQVISSRTKFSEIGGLENVKGIIQEMLIWPLKHYKTFQILGISNISGLLLFGPPGCGKTLLAKAISNESNSSFLNVHIPDLIKSEIGQSEKQLASVFKIARLCQPCVIFFDEIQAMFGKKREIDKHQRKLLSQLLIELDGLNTSEKSKSRIIVIAATNVPEFLDSCLFMSGRFERNYFVGPPGENGRKQIFLGQFDKLNVDKNEVVENIDNFNWLIAKSENFTGADIVSICQKAGLNALKRIILKTEKKKKEGNEDVKISMHDFKAAFRVFVPTITKGVVDSLKKWKPKK